MQLKDYFFDQYRDDMSLQQLSRVIASEYDSDDYRLAVQLQLGIITLEALMSDYNIAHVATVWNKIVEHINKFTLHCPPNVFAL